MDVRREHPAGGLPSKMLENSRRHVTRTAGAHIDR